MKTDQLTFNDLPAVVGELCDRIASMEICWQKTVQAAWSQRKHARPHDRAGSLRLSQNAVIDLLLQGQKDDIPVIKQGKHLYIYRDELDKWLESSRKNLAPYTFEEENEAMLASHRRKPNLKNW